MRARALTAQSGISLTERLDEMLLSDDVRRLADLADVVVLELEGAAQPAALVAVLERAGALASMRGDRVVVVSGSRALERAAAFAEPQECQAIVALQRTARNAGTRSSMLRARDRVLDFTDGAVTMGILNVTPDSFFDQGKYRGVDRARARAVEMVAQGARIVDIGGQSYAVGNPRIAAREERERVVPVVEALVRDGLDCVLSIDTFKADVAEAALDAGAHLINDCSGLRDPKLPLAVARAGAALVVMHLKGHLNVRAEAYPYDDAMREIIAFLFERTETIAAAGVARDAIMVDPGLEFGKEPPTDLEILERFGDLRGLGYPILFAASRKSFLGRLFDAPAEDLLVPSLAAAALGVAAGANVLRVHDIRETVALARTMGLTRRPVRTRAAYAERMPKG